MERSRNILKTIESPIHISVWESRGPFRLKVFKHSEFPLSDARHLKILLIIYFKKKTCSPLYPINNKAKNVSVHLSPICLRVVIKVSGVPLIAHLGVSTIIPKVYDIHCMSIQ